MKFLSLCLNLVFSCNSFKIEHSKILYLSNFFLEIWSLTINFFFVGRVIYLLTYVKLKLFWLTSRKHQIYSCSVCFSVSTTPDVKYSLHISAVPQGQITIFIVVILFQSVISNLGWPCDPLQQHAGHSWQ